MRFDTLWQRHPVSFALGLASALIVGLILMLVDRPSWNAVGVVCCTAPVLAAGWCYRLGRTRRC